jgi:FkbM family methyltransferase
MVTPDQIRAAYLFFLGRPPESDKAIRDHTNHPGLTELYHTLMTSIEFTNRLKGAAPATSTPVIPNPKPTIAPGSFSDSEVVERFASFSGPGKPGYVTDHLGGITRTSFVSVLPQFDGQVWPSPLVSEKLFPISEWIGTLRSVAEADPAKPFVMMEFGAGWGPWCVSSFMACKQRGITDAHVTAVEASHHHAAFARQNFIDNSLPAKTSHVIEGAVGASDGYVEFPELDDPSVDYGGSVGDTPMANRPKPTKLVRVTAYSINTLLKNVDYVNLIHIDVQGAEAAAVAAGLDSLNKKAHRLVIGTHGREIEHQLLDTLSKAGWLLEYDLACTYSINAGKFSLHADGCQLWRNPKV